MVAAWATCTVDLLAASYRLQCSRCGAKTRLSHIAFSLKFLVRHALSILTLLAFGAMCSQGSAQTASASAAPSADHPDTTPAGSTFTSPAGWSQADKTRLLQLTSPEGDYWLALVEAGEATDASSAVAAAWQLWAPERSRAPKLVTPRPARNGWDERVVVDYETSPNEKREMQAVAYRSGKSWMVLMMDGSQATAEKRAAAVSLVLQSLRPAGYVRETFAGKAANPMDDARIAQLRAFVADSMKTLGIPGASFAITTRKGTIYSTGLGVRVLGASTPVDADSEFMIASNTKGMSTLLLAKLVDEGKLAWDQPVTELYPAFRLGSAETTAKVKVKSLVCACTGLPRKDFEWLFNTSPRTPPSATFVQLAATEPTSKFGEVFQYNNLMASAAGFIGGHIVHPDLELGQAYDRAMQEKVFGPLGMTATTFDYSKAMSENWAQPYSDGPDGRPADLGSNGRSLNRAVLPYRPAGGAWSTANDLIKYVRFELDEGRLDDGTQYVSAKNLLERRIPNVATGENGTYGMGLMTDSTYGVDVIHHGGSLFGYKSDILLIPSAGIGAVLLTSADDGQLLLRPFQRRLLELLYDGKPEATSDVAAAAARNKGELATEFARISLVPDRDAVAALAGRYSSPELGSLKVTRHGSDVSFAFRTFTSKMGTRKNDDGTISFVTLDPAFLDTPFVVSRNGGKPSLKLLDNQHDYEFTADKAPQK